MNSNGDKLQISHSYGNALKINVIPKETFTKKNNCGMALILSRYENGVWKRSPSRRKIDVKRSNKYTFEDWLSTYQTTGAASKKYLNMGDERTGIQG